MAVGDWAPCQRYGIQQDILLDPADFSVSRLDVILVGVGAATIGDVPETATFEVEDEAIVKRVVGWVGFRVALLEPLTLIVHERIRVGLRDSDGDMTFFAEDLNGTADANEPFLWERSSLIELTGGIPHTWPQPDVGHPGWAQVDVRVARRLRRQDVLVYSVQMQAVNGDFDVTDVRTVFPWLRTWGRVLG